MKSGYEKLAHCQNITELIVLQCVISDYSDSVYPAVVWPRAGAGNEGGAPALAAVCPVPRVQVGSGGWLHTGTCRDKTGAAIRSTDGDKECCSGYPHQEAIKPLTRRQNKTITSSSNHKSQAGCLLVVRWPVAVVKWSCHIFPSFN